MTEPVVYVNELIAIIIYNALYCAKQTALVQPLQFAAVLLSSLKVAQFLAGGIGQCNCAHMYICNVVCSSASACFNLLHTSCSTLMATSVL